MNEVIRDICLYLSYVVLMFLLFVYASIVIGWLLEPFFETLPQWFKDWWNNLNYDNIVEGFLIYGFILAFLGIIIL